MVEDDVLKMTFSPYLWKFEEDEDAQYWHCTCITPALGYGWVILDKGAAVYQWEAYVASLGRTVAGLCDTREEAMGVTLRELMAMMGDRARCLVWQ